MTVIAWDGVTLAADKQNTISGYAHTVTKIFRVNGGIVGFMGRGAHAVQVLGWMNAGMIVADFPKAATEDESCTALFISEDKKAFAFCNSPHRLEYEDKFVAFGAGRDYALAAMHLGKTAFEACQIACELDVFCGKGIDTLTLESP